MIEPIYQYEDDAAANNGADDAALTTEPEKSPIRRMLEYFTFGLFLYPFLQGAAQGLGVLALHSSVAFFRSLKAKN